MITCTHWLMPQDNLFGGDWGQFGENMREEWRWERPLSPDPFQFLFLLSLELSVPLITLILLVFWTDFLLWRQLSLNPVHNSLWQHYFLFYCHILHHYGREHQKKRGLLINAQNQILRNTCSILGSNSKNSYLTTSASKTSWRSFQSWYIDCRLELKTTKNCQQDTIPINFVYLIITVRATFNMGGMVA